MSIVGSIQARMNSTRLPGKTLRMVAGKPLLGWQISRLKKSRLLDDIVVATSTSPEDDLLEEYCDQNEIKCFRGSEHDVLGRVAGLIEKYEIDTHVELYGDCPLIDPEIIDDMVNKYLKEKKTYYTMEYDNNSTFPEITTALPASNLVFNSETLFHIFPEICPVLSRNSRSIYRSPVRA